MKMGASTRIVSPQNQSIPLEGKWKIESCISRESSIKNENKSEQWVGKTAQFTSTAAVVGEYSWNNPSYSIKYVNAEEYIVYKFGTSVEKLGINDKDINVVTVTAGEKYLYEFVKVNDTELFVKIDNNVYTLIKISDSAESDFHKDIENEDSVQLEVSKDEQLLRTGLMLGIRSQKKTASTGEKNSDEEYSYKTLWIASTNRELHPVLETDDIYLPRKSGFWKVMVRRNRQNDREEDELLAYNSSKDNMKKSNIESIDDFWNNKTGRINKKILFIGNDYVCLEINGDGTCLDSSETWNIDKFQIRPIDNISNAVGVKISDVAADNGLLAMKAAKSKLIETFKSNDIVEINKEMEDENFALYRKTGHWFVKGRLNFKQNDTISYSDFNINIIPPSKIVFYDTLQVPWTVIKDRVPEAVDAYTSPNKDIAVVITNNRILIYEISNGGLSNVPIKKIMMKDGDAVVMAEWALGNYVQKWEESFLTNEIRKVE